MNDDILVKNLIKNTEIVYGIDLQVELVKLSIWYLDRYRRLDVFGELRGESNDFGIEITTTFVTDEGEYSIDDESNTFYSNFPGIQSFKCSLRLDDALIKCQKLKIKIERKMNYARSY